jgi:FixJ family two-component response regulator
MSIRHKILVVDDEAEFLHLVEEIVLNMGYSVITAVNGLDGLEKLKNNQPISVIISDQKMPKIEGNAFLQMAKKISPHSQRVMITAFRDSKIMEESVNSGEVFRFLHKPVKIESVEEIVKTGVKRYEQQLIDEEESKKKDRTIHTLIERLNRKPIFEKGFILFLFISLAFIIVINFSQPPQPHSSKAKPANLESSSGPKTITLDECLKSAQAQLSTCSEELTDLAAENKLTESQKSRRQASCEAIHLQKKTICQARYSD